MVSTTVIMSEYLMAELAEILSTVFNSFCIFLCRMCMRM